MRAITKIKSSRIVNGIRLLTALVTGKNDVREYYETSPYGWDSSPVANVKAVYMSTLNRGDNVNTGYIATDRIAQPGESRMYSTDSSGSTKYFVYCYTDKVVIGTGSPSNHLTQFEALNEKLQDQISQINTQLDAIQAGISSAGGSYVPVHIVEDFTGAKTNNILIN